MFGISAALALVQSASASAPVPETFWHRVIHSLPSDPASLVALALSLGVTILVVVAGRSSNGKGKGSGTGGLPS
jgi:hypothetical protein